MMENGFIMNPYFELLPDYKICPFSKNDMIFNRELSSDSTIDDYFNLRFGHRTYQYTLNGREAIGVALEYYNLQKEDTVTIFTTTNNFYISSCVTAEIEKKCKWSRKIEENTKVLFINHEFGFPFYDVSTLLHYGLPIIEDCAHSFFSNNSLKNVGTHSDFVIYSFPKAFPIQIGGLIVSKFSNYLSNKSVINDSTKQYLKNVLSYHIKSSEDIIDKRVTNYSILSERFRKLGFEPRFEITQGIAPGVFIFRTESRKINLPKLKIHYHEHGIQSSVFYGEEAFFIPCHQNLDFQDLEYFYTVMLHFIN